MGYGLFPVVGILGSPRLLILVSIYMFNIYVHVDDETHELIR